MFVSVRCSTATAAAVTSSDHHRLFSLANKILSDRKVGDGYMMPKEQLRYGPLDMYSVVFSLDCVCVCRLQHIPLSV